MQASADVSVLVPGGGGGGGGADLDDLGDEDNHSDIRSRSHKPSHHHASKQQRQQQQQLQQLNKTERMMLYGQRALIWLRVLNTVIIFVIGVVMLVYLADIMSIIQDLRWTGDWVRVSGVTDSAATTMGNAAVISGNVTQLLNAHSQPIASNIDLTLSKLGQVPFADLSDNAIELMNLAAHANITELIAKGSRLLGNADDVTSAMSGGGTMLLGLQLPSTKSGGGGGSAAMVNMLRGLPVQTEIDAPTNTNTNNAATSSDASAAPKSTASSTSMHPLRKLLSLRRQPPSAPP